MTCIRRQVSKAARLATSLFYHGVVDLFQDPRAAATYWRRMARAALYSPEGDSGEWLGLPRCNIEQIIPGAESIPVTLIEYRYTYGDMPVEELMMLCRIVRYGEPSVIFEIGTYLGGTTLQLAANSKAEVYTLDLPPAGHNDYVKAQIWDPESDIYPEQPGVRFQGSPYADRIYQLFGDSQTYDFSPFYGKVDLVVIDGCHHYEYVFRDSGNALRMISSRGTVVWHDYASYAPGVVQVLNELAGTISLKQLAGTGLVIYQK